MILDHRLVAAGDKDEMLDAGAARFIDHVLDQRPVDHRQHFLRHSFGCRQEPGAKAGDGKNRFTDWGHTIPEMRGERTEYALLPKWRVTVRRIGRRRQPAVNDSTYISKDRPPRP